MFRPLSDAVAGLSLSDDAAILPSLPAGKSLVCSKDVLQEGVHFFADDNPEDIAAKLLRVNLSDMAAMGAVPLYYMLGISAPVGKYDIVWLEKFVGSLREEQERFNISLIGGDTTNSLHNLSLSVTIFGMVDEGKSLRRCGAAIGDIICVTGNIGDAFLGLRLIESQALRDVVGADDYRFLTGRYHRATPRIQLAERLANLGIASSAIDISDGLVQDMEHICRASDCAALINIDEVPISRPAATILQKLGKVEKPPILLADILSGGDDYELLFTVSPDRFAELDKLSRVCDVKVSAIGEVVSYNGDDGLEGCSRVRVVDATGRSVTVKRKGWQHTI